MTSSLPSPVQGSPLASRLRSMFAPKGIAIVGASTTSVWSKSLYGNLTRGGYPHPIYLVNRRGEEAHGRQTVTSLGEIGEHVDLAYVLSGPAAAESIVADAAAAGIPNLVVIAAGFAETGADGARQQRELAELARSNGQFILGPNNLGFINLTDRTPAWSTIMTWPLDQGGVSILSQSGALLISLMKLTQARDIGIDHLVSVGNEAMLTVAECLDYVVEQPGTRVIAAYLESIRNPELFLAAADRALRAGKPIVVYKAGRGELGAKITAAHTGSLASDNRVLEAVFREHGIIMVDSMESLITTSGLLDAYGELPGERVAFVTSSGAMCARIGDIVEEEGLILPDFEPATGDKMRAAGLPDFATVQNPLDTTGVVLNIPHLADTCERLIIEDPNIDILVVSSSTPADERDVRATMFKAGRPELIKNLPSRKRVVEMEFLVADRNSYSRQYRRDHGGSFVVDSYTMGIPALRRAIWWSGRVRDARRARNSRTVEPLPVVSGGREFWSEREAGELLRSRGVPVAAQRLVTSAETAAAAAATAGFPAVFKVSSPSIQHKTDVGGVRLGVASAAEAAEAYEDIMRRVAQAAPDAEIEGVLVSPMRADGVDLLVGVIRDPTWGLVLVVGIGGIWVELLDDSAVHRLPVDHEAVLAMLARLKGFRLLTGARGQAPADLGALADVIVTIADTACALGDSLEELEVNPLRVSASGAEVLDALIRWRVPAEAAAEQVRDVNLDRTTMESAPRSR